MIIKRTKNRGFDCWKLDYYDSSGKRVRRFFATKALAEAERDNVLTQEKSAGQIWLALTAEERNALISVNREVVAAGFGLRQVWEEFKALRAAGSMPQSRITLKAAADLTATVKRTEGCRGKYLTELEWYLSKFVAGREAMFVDQITTADLDHWFSHHHAGHARTGMRSRIGMLSSMFGVCLKRGHIKSNPCLPLIGGFRVDPESPVLLTIDQTKKLLTYCLAHRDLLTFYVLGLFTGMRPEEIHRLHWGAIDLDHRIVVVDAAVSKIHRRRVIELEDAAVEWLKVCEPYRGKRKKDDETPKTRWRAAATAELVKSSRAELKDAAGIGVWEQDIIRHTAASYLLGLLKDAGKAAYRLGHSERVLDRDYKNLVTPAQVAEYWALRPGA